MVDSIKCSVRTAVDVASIPKGLACKDAVAVVGPIAAVGMNRAMMHLLPSVSKLQ